MASIKPPRVPGATRERKNRQINDYKRRTQRIYILNVSKRTEQDVIGWLEQNKPYQTAIKWLVREQIKREEASADLENEKASYS